ncbi:hypothetical protein GCM10010433_54700 [Streptomyces pulveraceus]
MFVRRCVPYAGARVTGVRGPPRVAAGASPKEPVINLRSIRATDVAAAAGSPPSPPAPRAPGGNARTTATPPGPDRTYGSRTGADRRFRSEDARETRPHHMNTTHRPARTARRPDRTASVRAAVPHTRHRATVSAASR